MTKKKYFIKTDVIPSVYYEYECHKCRLISPVIVGLFSEIIPRVPDTIPQYYYTENIRVVTQKHYPLIGNQYYLSKENLK